MSKYGLGYLQLNSREKQAYEKIESDLLRYSTHLDVPAGIDLANILSVVLGDNPSIIYVTNPKILIAGGLITRRASLMGAINRSKAMAMEKELQKKLRTLHGRLILKLEMTVKYFKVYRIIFKKIFVTIMLMLMH